MRGNRVVDNRGVTVLVDKAIVFAACLALATLGPRAHGADVAWLLVAVAATAAVFVLEDRAIARLLPVAYLLAAVLSPASLLGIPLAAYDLARAYARGGARAGAAPYETSRRLLTLVAFSTLLIRMCGWVTDTPALALAPAVAALAGLVAVRTAHGEETRARLHTVRDDLAGRLRDLALSRARLQEAQDVEMRAAALGERTRIAREIHDGVGHQLTRLLFQVRALAVTHRAEPDVVADLEGVDVTVNEALDAMRRSVHALDDEAEDLSTSLNVLASRCAIADVSVDCSAQTLPARVTRLVVAVVREALTNAARHGHASSAHVAVFDYPAFWRVTVDNDGALAVATGSPHQARRAESAMVTEGMGLRTMRERVEALGGSLRFLARPRFTVLVTIPKEIS